jgi:hypothetical protein
MELVSDFLGNSVVAEPEGSPLDMILTQFQIFTASLPTIQLNLFPSYSRVFQVAFRQRISPPTFCIHFLSTHLS